MDIKEEVLISAFESIFICSSLNLSFSIHSQIYIYMCKLSNAYKPTNRICMPFWSYILGKAPYLYQNKYS